MVAAGSSCRVACGPEEPLGQARLGVVVDQQDPPARPGPASPARWWSRLVLPTPPFWFNSVTTGTSGPSTGVGIVTRMVSARGAMLRRTGLLTEGTDAEGYLRLSCERYQLLRSHSWDDATIERLRGAKA